VNLQDKSDIRAVFAIKTIVHSVGGAERMAAALTGALARSGMDIHLLTMDRPEEQPFFPVDPAVKRHFASTDNTARKTGFLEYPALLWRLRQQVTALRPDIVIAFMHSMFVPLQCALLGTGVKVVLSEHTAPAYYKARFIEFMLLRFFSLFVTSITIVSESIRALYPYEMRRKMVILPDPVISDFAAADENSKTILSVGRLNKDKDHAVLIDAFALLPQEFGEWDLKIYGEGPERETLENLIAAHGLAGRVTLPGVTTAMDRVYTDAQLFVLPSRYESFGLATAEAMSHALPVIGFADCSGTNDLIQNEHNGLLVAKRSAADFAAALRTLLTAPHIRRLYGENGQQDAQKYSLENVASAWKSTISNIVTGKTTP